MSNFEYRDGQYKNASPIYVALAWAIVANISDGVKLYLQKIPVGSSYSAERIMLIFVLLFFIAAIHLKSTNQNDPVDKFLYENLPSILFGFSLSFFLSSVFPFYIGVLIGLSGYLLYVERNET